MVNFNPAIGSEQRDERPALVLSPAMFNKFGMTLIAPITQGGSHFRHIGFAVSVSGTGMKTQGVVLLNQVRMVDMTERNARYIERADDVVVKDALLKLVTIVDL